MRTTLHIDKEIIFLVILLVLGGYCFYVGGISIIREKNITSLENLSVETCKEGEYVAGTVDYYVGKMLKTFSGKDSSFTGTGTTWLLGGKEYDVYTLPIKDDYYIQVMISDKDKLSCLEQYDNGFGTGVYIEGQVVKAFSAPQYSWYEDVPQIKNPEEQIIADYVIKEVDLKEKSKIVWAGPAFLLVALLQFLRMGGMWDIISHKELQEKTESLSAKGDYYKQSELVAARYRLKALESELEDKRKGCIYRIPILLIGFFFICKIHLLIGILMVFIAIKGICNYMFNCGWKWTDRAMHLFGKESTALQIKEVQNRIIKLKE